MLDVSDIKRLLPHRYPMLLVDRVVAMTPGESLVAIKAVTANEPCYATMADGCDNHEYPPTLLIESWCQAAGVLVCLDLPNPDVLANKVTLFAGISDLELSGPVHPGDVVEHHVRLVRALSNEAMLTGEAMVNGTVVLRIGYVIIAMRPAGTQAVAVS